jgi:hypothetical protein
MRMFFALCALENYTIYGGDAQDAFAHPPAPSVPTFISICDEFADWYFQHFNKQINRSKVLPIRHALQGHPEAARLWETHISAILVNIGFQSTTHKKNVYRATINASPVLLCRQVDDFALGTTDLDTATKIYDAIGKHLQLPNEPVAPFVSEGVISSYNGVDFLQTRHYIKLSAETYIRCLLISHSWSTPANDEQPDPSRSKEPLPPRDIPQLYQLSGPHEDTPDHAALEHKMGFRYRTLLGELLYAYIIGQLDIGYVITTLAKCSTNPAPFHYTKLRNVAKYLRRTIDWGLVYWREIPNTTLPDIPHIIPIYDPSDDLPAFPSASLRELIGYVDATHANDLCRHRSTTGYDFVLAGAAIAY